MKIVTTFKKDIFLNLSFLFFALLPLQLEAAPSSSRLIQAGKDVIAAGSQNTSCSAYVQKVLNRAGYKFGSFMANGFHSSMQKHLPSWKSQRFSAYEGNGRPALRAFLNSFPNQTAFLAQWVRSGRSGHVAMVVKNGPNKFTIYQAQLGRALPHSKGASVEKLLYPRNQYGDRSNLRIFFN